MTRPSTAQIDAAIRLLKAIEANKQGTRNLERLISAAEATNSVVENARFERLNILTNPDRLAGLLELGQRTDIETKRRIAPTYARLLDLMQGGSEPGYRPHKVDFDQLTPGARPYLLAPFLNLSVSGVYPRLCLDRSEPAQGRLVYVVSSGAVELDAWRRHMPRVSAWLGGQWAIQSHTATTITLFRQTPLPKDLPLDPTWFRPGRIFLGLDVGRQQPLQIPIPDFAHTLIAGTTGMGKSVAIDTILRSLLSNAGAIEHIYAVDPAGIAFGRYRGVHPKLTTLSRARDLWTTVARLVRTMEQRESELEAKALSKLSDRFIFLIIDEFPAFNTPDTVDKKSDDFKAHQAFVANIMALGRRARKTGIKLIFIVQEPTDRDISAGIRSVLPGLLAFRTPLVAHATSLFGELGQLPADPRTLSRGRALYRDGTSGKIAEVQFPATAAPERRSSG